MNIIDYKILFAETLYILFSLVAESIKEDWQPLDRIQQFSKNSHVFCKRNGNYRRQINYIRSKDAR